MKNQTHSCCVAFYYDPKTGDQDLIVRIGVVVTSLENDQTVDRREFFIGHDNLDLAVQEIIELAESYDTPVTMVDGPQPLKLCGCGCNQFMDFVITSKDLEELSRSKRVRTPPMVLH